MDVLDTPDVRDLLACIGAVVSDTDSAAWLRVAALRQFSVDPNELRSAIRALPRDSTATVASVLSSVKGGGTILETVRQARQETSGNKIFAVQLSLVRQFQLARSPAINSILQFSNEWEKSPITKTGEPGEFLEYLDYFREARGSVPLPSRDEQN